MQKSESQTPNTQTLLFFFFTLGAGPRRCSSLKLSDTRVYEPQIRARLGTTQTINPNTGGGGGENGADPEPEPAHC